MTFPHSPLALMSLAAAAGAAAILIGYLVRKPPLVHATKIWLLVGLGVLPITAAATGNIEGYEATKKRTFCGSCHVMVPYATDAENAQSHSLAARHARNHLFGEDNCYMCHADYGMFGTVTTKIGGMRHVWLYATEYHDMPLEKALPTIHIRKPFPNSTCMQCHSTELDLWKRVPDHKASIEELRSGRLGCASGGCHGYAHPFTKPPPEKVKLPGAPPSSSAEPKPGAPQEKPSPSQGATP